jgi:hypothetical protein
MSSQRWFQRMRHKVLRRRVRWKNLPSLASHRIFLIAGHSHRTVLFSCDCPWSDTPDRSGPSLLEIYIVSQGSQQSVFLIGPVGIQKRYAVTISSLCSVAFGLLLYLTCTVVVLFDMRRYHPVELLRVAAPG